jgi:hypothetical protein
VVYKNLPHVDHDTNVTVENYHSFLKFVLKSYNKVSTPKCDTCFGLVNWGGGGNKKIHELISKCKRN